MTTSEERRLARHADEARAHITARNRLIIRMRSGGYTYRALASLAGLAPNAIVKIVRKDAEETSA